MKNEASNILENGMGKIYLSYIIYVELEKLMSQETKALFVRA